MKNFIYALFACVLMASCGGENKKTETSAQPETTEEVSPEAKKMNTIESTVDEINTQTEDLNSDLDSLINAI